MAVPRVSVIMTVYNAEAFVSRSIKSILDQTFKDFEFIIIDDGSTDNTLKIIKSFNDTRLIVKSQKNSGVPKASNRAIALAKGEYIARQDADDYSSIQRLEKQVDFLDKHPDIGLIGTNYTAVNLDGEIVFVTDFFTQPDDLNLATVFSNQFGHGSTMVRKSTLNKVGGYHEISIVHDYDLWVRISHSDKMANLKDRLYTWTFHGKSLSNSRFDNTLDQSKDVRENAFRYFIEHRREFKKYSFHPFTTRSLGGYFSQKSKIYRNAAIMFANHGMRRSAIPVLLIAVIYSPFNIKNLVYLYTVVLKKERIARLTYE
jgi:glycosyltransferase involved in cell wall biosynthesis